MKSNVWALSVTDLALCRRCPRLLAYRRARRARAWRVGIIGSGDAYGSLFHNHIAGTFFSDASRMNGENRAALMCALREGTSGAPALRGALEELVRVRYFYPFLEKEEGRRLSADRVVAMALGTQVWIRLMADFLADVPSLISEPEKNAARVFTRPEAKLRGCITYPDGRCLEVKGRCDALLFNPDAARAALFEFKGHKESSPAALSQVLLYAWMLQDMTGVVPAVHLLHLEEPEEKVQLSFSPPQVLSMMDELSSLFASARAVLEGARPLPGPFVPNLCDCCDFEGECDKAWGARPTASVSLPLPVETEDERREAQGHMNRLIETLRKMKVEVSDEGFVCGACFIRLKVLPDAARGATVSKLENKAKDLQVQMGLAAPPFIQPQPGYVGVDVPRAKRQPLNLEDLLKADERPRGVGAFPLGMRVDGRVFWANLAEPSMSSALIGGASGSGKSVLLRSIVLGLLLCAPPGAVGFTLIDPKKVTFSDFKNLRALEEGVVLFDAESALETLQEAVGEMERRYDLLESAGVSDLEAYNVRSGEFLRRRVVVIDEYADLMASKEMAKELEGLVQRIGQKGRAAGLHLLLATQRPDSKTVTGVIKANLQLRIALKVGSRSNSTIILGDGFGQAQYLLGHGDMLVGDGTAVERLQGAQANPSSLGREFWKD